MAVNLNYFYPVMEWNQAIEDSIVNEYKKRFGINLTDYINNQKDIFEAWENIVDHIFGINRGPVLFKDKLVKADPQNMFDVCVELVDTFAHNLVDPKILYEVHARYDIYEKDIWPLASLTISFLESGQEFDSVPHENERDLTLDYCFPEIASGSFCKQFRYDLTKGKSKIIDIFATDIWDETEGRDRKYSEWKDYKLECGHGHDNVTRWSWERNHDNNENMYSSSVRTIKDKDPGDYKCEDLLVYSKLINSGLVRRIMPVADVDVDKASEYMDIALKFRGKAWQTFWVELKKILEERGTSSYKPENERYIDFKPDEFECELIRADRSKPVTVLEKRDHYIKIKLPKEQPDKWGQYLNILAYLDGMLLHNAEGIQCINEHLDLLTKAVIFLYEHSDRKEDDKAEIDKRALDAIKEIDNLQPKESDKITQSMEKDLLSRQIKKKNEGKKENGKEHRLYLQKKDESLNSKYCYLQAYTISHIQKLFSTSE